jgi:nitrite reductase/ring-hydroxylating ferredoxin subunit
MPDENSEAWHKVATTDEITEDSPKQVYVGDTAIGIFRVKEQIYAIDDICTHEYAPLTEGYVDGELVECPLHAAQFHIPTGDVLAPPATEKLRTYRVRVDGNDILVEVPRA